jgi:hypothetical protein
MRRSYAARKLCLINKTFWCHQFCDEVQLAAVLSPSVPVLEGVLRLIRVYNSAKDSVRPGSAAINSGPKAPTGV